MVFRTHPPEHSLAARLTYRSLDPTGTGKAVRLGGRTPEDAPRAVEST